MSRPSSFVNIANYVFLCSTELITLSENVSTETAIKTETIFSRMSNTKEDKFFNLKFFVYCTYYFYIARPSTLSKSFLFFTFCKVIFQRTRPLYKSLFGQTSEVLLTLVSKMEKKSY